MTDGRARNRARAPALAAFPMAVCLLVLAAGCNGARAPHSAGANAPALNGDAPLYDRGGDNPNAPFTVLDRSTHLTVRPAVIDINAAEPCLASQLSLFESGAQVNGSHRLLRLNLVNHASAPCRLSGYPSISLLRPDGSLIGNISIEKVAGMTLEATLHARALPEQIVEKKPSPLVLIAPSGEATFEVGWSSGPGCDPVGSIAVAAPGTLQSFAVHHELTVCEGRILVTAVNDGAQL